MSIISIQNIDFKYPDGDDYIFKNMSLEIGSGVTSLVGQNGTGKTTMLLLCAGLIVPENGIVKIIDTNTADITHHNERQKLISYIYQNMEFESEENVISLLHFVYNNGFHTNKDDGFIKELIDVFELNQVLNKKTHEISKGELQRVIIAFSLLYGSKIIVMDEPIFALEDYQKHKTMDYMVNYSRSTGTPIIYSAHELDITEKYSDNVCFFYKESQPVIGETKRLYNEKNLEEVFNVPFSMLKQKEYLFRETLIDKIL